ncbi:TetR/AcrR family transcriptional regulator C-terminal domain-containing protein [Streptomyces oryzae]|uniref:TetR/AcrR family transcriptional regulator C-terminal domain-containing protein n=1 Tax=Streptomyces oryzae TaxID=1434886 RepID=A0ABS3X964_9ACTN|nr:TetR/AcrR family transcriptional regulator [Streptomyces oryzae]MBO8191925.1 TetR/AcrR family transcriptional regulator C-terminal domain-containing protein [Streptomyces oryzae]
MTTEHSADTEHTAAGEGLTRLVRSLDLLWGRAGQDRPARGPKPGLTLAQIVATAVELADREGLTALSMRRVAGELGVGTMSLYRYVPGKDELVALMCDHVLGSPGELEQSRGKDWRTTLELIAESSWELYTTHTWLIQVNQARPVLGPNSMADLDFALTALDGLPLSGQEKMNILVAVDNLVMGAARSHVLYQQAAQQSGVSDEEFWHTQEPYIVRGMEEGGFTRLAALPDDAFATDLADSTRFAVRALLDGFQLLLDQRRSAPPRQ